MRSRRTIIKSLLSSSAVLLSPKILFAAQKSSISAIDRTIKQNHTPNLGVHLPLWHQGTIDPNKFWPKLFHQLKDHNIQHCMILNYYFVDPVTGKISKTSQFNNNQAPSLAFLEQGLKFANQKNIKASLYPVLEIDNPHKVGGIWRGNLNFFGTTLKNFFTQYNQLILQLAQISRSYNTPYIYIGSELASLTHNIAARPYWEQLIYNLRKAQQNHPQKQKSSLIYAAHWEEYLSFPFWRQIDEIGINSYAPLSSNAEASGISHPTIKIIEENIKRKLDEFHTFANKHQRPLQISEFGLTSYDLTSATPWQQTPSDRKDTHEQLNAYTALFNCLKSDNHTQKPDNHTQEQWLSSVNLWHWQLPERRGSNYNITPGSPLAKLIKAY